MQWSPIGLGDANRFTTVETSQAEYNASVGEFVKSTGQEVVLPEPTENGIVVVRNVGPQLRVSAVSGLVHTDSSFRRLDSKEPVYLVSDGVNWYSLSGTDGFLPAIPNTVVSRQNDNTTANRSGKSGLGVLTKTDWPSIAFRISINTEEATRAYIHELDENDELASLVSDTDISTKSSDDIVVFDSINLSDGERFGIVLDAEGADFTIGAFDTDSEANYPYETDDIDIIGRIFDGASMQSTTSNDPVAVNDIGNPGGVL